MQETSFQVPRDVYTEFITMRKGQKATQIEPGTTVISYVDDSAAFVGITVPHNDTYSETHYSGFSKRPSDFVTCLVLGWFTKSCAVPNADVMGSRELHPFPTFHVLMAEDHVFPYEFTEEIKLCQHQARQWKEMDTGIFSNLIAKHFFPKNGRALLQIHNAQHLMRGRGAEGRPKWHSWSPASEFLHVWAVLRHIFPDRVLQPPEKFTEGGPSNSYYYVVWDCDPRKIRVESGWNR